MVRPYLMDKLNQSFPDPSQFKNEREFNYAAMTASVFKKVVAELINWIEMQTTTAKALEKKEREGVNDPFDIGK